MKKITIALAGNPNSGKTTLFNALTGSNQYVGNWPGVTVEKKEGKYKKDSNITITDLPGIYSLSPYTLEEVVAREYLLNERPDVILDIVDGTNLERNLYLTTQFMELGIPVVVAINMMDVVEKKGDKINIEELSKKLRCKVIPISALKGDSVFDAAEVAIEVAKEGKRKPQHIFSGIVEHALAHIEEACIHNMEDERQRWYSVKLFERDEKVLKELKLDQSIIKHIDTDIKAVEEYFDDDAEAVITNERYTFIESLMRTCYKRKNDGKPTASDRIDKILTNRILALPIFALIMWGVYTLSIGTIGAWTVEFMNDTLFGEWVVPFITTFLKNIGCADWLNSLISDGIVGGVGAVLGFVPQMFILFFLLSILESIGYMSRVAFIMDKIFRKLGLSGKSFIPMLVASGCGVPGIMASRTIEQDRDRKMTIMTTAFIPCGAKMPIVALIAAALFDGGAWVATLAYFVGIGAVVVSGIILKKTKAFAGDPAPFVMELPAYHMPLFSNVLRTTWERGWSFVKRAGSVILLASIIIWVLNSLSLEGGLHYITDTNDGDSVLAAIGNVISFIFVPLGFGNWQCAVATILGLVAKEEIAGVFGSLSDMFASANPEAAADLLGAMEGGVSNIALIGQEFFGGSKLSGISFLIFNLLCAPCFAAMGAIRREMNNAKWTFFAIGYMTVFAYAISLIVYNIGMLFSGVFTVWTVLAILVLALLIYLIFRKNKFENNKLK
ncbi:MAG: ferrous iron transport protein B [Ruminococcaceae bacterium]|nr:ferrous iron transport protein B [Oscillospiraceae bacterium]